jgi:hypothetical protein
MSRLQPGAECRQSSSLLTHPKRAPCSSPAELRKILSFAVQDLAVIPPPVQRRFISSEDIDRPFSGPPPRLASSPRRLSSRETDLDRFGFAVRPAYKSAVQKIGKRSHHAESFGLLHIYTVRPVVSDA